VRSDAPAASREPWNRDKIQQLLLEAGHIAERSKQDMGCELKADRSIVTRADREIEALFSREFDQPDQGSFLIGEETVGQKGEEYIQEAFRGVAYVVDPIDGTSPYAHHLPTWGISVGRMAAGRLTDGAVYLPDFGEMVLSEENAVVEGKLSGGKWSWRELDAAPRALTVSGLVAITQGLAKHGRVSLPNPVLVLGVAVVPMIGLLQERFQAYLGSVKLWDIAGALPLLLRKGYSVTVFPRGERRVVTEAVEASTYDLTPGSKLRWALQTDLLICHPGDEVQLRASFSSGDLDRSME
jgi:myo-inositol-1(or 4)-monophosphatase